jgi:hypothetical protein
LRSAKALWQRVEAAYDAARTAVLLARAHLALGDRELALMEARNARRAFERLGAAMDIAAAAALFEQIGRTPA